MTTDRCRPYGIPRPLVPSDDEDTEARAELLGMVDSVRAGIWTRAREFSRSVAEVERVRE